MNKTNIGIFSIAAGFLLIWGGATGRLGSAWSALVHGSTGGTPSKETGCPEGQRIGDGGQCIPIDPTNNDIGGDGGPSRTRRSMSLATNGLMSAYPNGSA